MLLYYQEVASCYIIFFHRASSSAVHVKLLFTGFFIFVLFPTVYYVALAGYFFFVPTCLFVMGLFFDL